MNHGNDSLPAGGPSPTPPSDSPSPQPNGPAPVPTAPPAAAVVASAQRTEREVHLESEVEVGKVTLKQREQRINQLEDENRRIKEVLKPKAKADKKPGWTLFH